MTSIFFTKPKAAEAQVRRPVLDPIKALDSVRRVRSEDQLRAAFAEIAARGGTSTAKILVEGDFSISAPVILPDDGGRIILDLGGFTLRATRSLDYFLARSGYDTFNASTPLDAIVQNGVFDAGDSLIPIVFGGLHRTVVRDASFNLAFTATPGVDQGPGTKVKACVVERCNFDDKNNVQVAGEGFPGDWQNTIVRSCVFDVECRSRSPSAVSRPTIVEGCQFLKYVEGTIINSFSSFTNNHVTDVTASRLTVSGSNCRVSNNSLRLDILVSGDDNNVNGNNISTTANPAVVSGDNNTFTGNVFTGGTITDSGTNNTVADNVT